RDNDGDLSGERKLLTGAVGGAAGPRRTVRLHLAGGAVRATTSATLADTTLRHARTAIHARVIVSGKCCSSRFLHFQNPQIRAHFDGIVAQQGRVICVRTVKMCNRDALAKSEGYGARAARTRGLARTG